jgi:hypothetical protein
VADAWNAAKIDELPFTLIGDYIDSSSLLNKEAMTSN